MTRRCKEVVDSPGPLLLGLFPRHLLLVLLEGDAGGPHLAETFQLEMGIAGDGVSHLVGLHLRSVVGVADPVFYGAVLR